MNFFLGVAATDFRSDRIHKPLARHLLPVGEGGLRRKPDEGLQSLSTGGIATPHPAGSAGHPLPVGEGLRLCAWGTRAYSAASISSMSFFRSALTSSLSDTPLASARGEKGQHFWIEMDRRRQDRIRAVELAALCFGEIIFVLHDIGFWWPRRASFRVGRRAEMMRMTHR